MICGKGVLEGQKKAIHQIFIFQAESDHDFCLQKHLELLKCYNKVLL